jgi:hypothetical protein
MENLQDSLERAIGGIRFSSKRIDTDEFTKEKGDTYVKYLYGCRSYYTIPYGGIMCLPKNQWIFELACIHFMKFSNLIPMKYVSGINKTIEVKRASGSIQKASIDPLNGLIYDKNLDDFLLRCNLSDNCLEEPTIYSEIVKSVRLSDIMILNNINEIDVEFPNILRDYSNNEDIFENNYDDDIIDIQNNAFETIAELINNFNELNKDKHLKINIKLWV